MSPSRTEDSAEGAGKVLSPAFLAHVVFVTANLPKMVKFWTTFLGGSITHENSQLAFIRYDEEHHRIAIINVPGTLPRHPASAGMHHVAFTFNNLRDLVTAYNQRKAHGILPVRCVNHGPTTSMYYFDPDGNTIESQVDNFDTPEEGAAFMNSDLFAQNPIGTDFEPEDLIAKLDAGIDDKIIKKRIEIGARGLPAQYTEVQAALAAGGE